MTTPKQKIKAQRKLGDFRRKNGWGQCWVCGSTAGVKTSREGYGVRCKGCIERGATNEDVIEYERLKETFTV